MAEQCPFELAYDAFWDALEESAVFLALFPHGTRKQVRDSTASHWQQLPRSLDLNVTFTWVKWILPSRHRTSQE